MYLDASHSGDKVMEELSPMVRLRSVQLQSLFLHSNLHVTNTFITTLFAFGFPKLKVNTNKLQLSISLTQTCTETRVIKL